MYKINEIAKIANISTRTLRHYDEIGLLTPLYSKDNGYRNYTDENIDLLQLILFYKELGYKLEEIKGIVKDPHHNILTSLKSHAVQLQVKRNKLDEMINLVNTTINNKERNIKMSNKDKFEAFKQSMLSENEKQYGKELREKFDDSFVKKSNQKYKNKSKKQFENHELLTKELNIVIKKAHELNDPSSELAMQMCLLHKAWLMFYWPSYNELHHLSLVEMYTLDERFTKYYDNISVGSALFLLKAMKLYIRN